jgi:hypothetical protein
MGYLKSYFKKIIIILKSSMKTAKKKVKNKKATEQ